MAAAAPIALKEALSVRVPLLERDAARGGGTSSERLELMGRRRRRRRRWQGLKNSLHRGAPFSPPLRRTLAASAADRECDTPPLPAPPRRRPLGPRARGKRHREAAGRQLTPLLLFPRARWFFFLSSFFSMLSPSFLRLPPSFRASSPSPPSSAGTERGRRRRRVRVGGRWKALRCRKQGAETVEQLPQLFFFLRFFFPLPSLSPPSTSTLFTEQKNKTAPGRRRRRAVRHLHQHHHGV